MATDAKNLKITRVTSAVRSQFMASTPSQGSIYFDLVDKVIRVGDGATAGGVPLVNVNQLSTQLSTKVSQSELETAMRELITEWGGTPPA